MTWFRVDDTLAFHRKVIDAGNAAMGLWVRAGSWSSQHLTDGCIPLRTVKLLGTVSQARRLVTAGLWMETDDGFQFHDWSIQNPTAATVRDRQKTAAARQEAWRSRKKFPSSTSKNKDGTSTILEKIDGLFPEEARSEDGVTHNEGDRRNAAPTRPDPIERAKALSGGCGGLTIQGNPCKNPAGGSGFCPHHAESDVRHDVLAMFGRFWNAYPSKKGPEAAKKSWMQAVARKAGDAEGIIAAAKRFAKDPDRKPEYTPHPAKWLDEGRYDDGPGESDSSGEWRPW